MVDLSDVCRHGSFDHWFSGFFIIHLADLRSVKSVQKSLKSQGIFQLLKSGNPSYEEVLYIVKFNGSVATAVTMQRK